MSTLRGSKTTKNTLIVTEHADGHWQLWKKEAGKCSQSLALHATRWQAEKDADLIARATGWPVRTEKIEVELEEQPDEPCQKCGRDGAEDIDCALGGDQHLCEPCARVEAPHMFADSDPS